jgi:predicted nucleic acid-binding protein
VSFLLDTNIVSEWMRPRPDPGVMRWLAEADEDRVYLSVVTLAELRRGIDRLADGQRRRRLEDWLSREIPQRFEGRILPIGATIAHAWGELVAKSERAGRPLGVMDAFIAATAAVHDLAVVSRDTTAFRHWTKAVIDPWEA